MNSKMILVAFALLFIVCINMVPANGETCVDQKAKTFRGHCAYSANCNTVCKAEGARGGHCAFKGRAGRACWCTLCFNKAALEDSPIE